MIRTLQVYPSDDIVREEVLLAVLADPYRYIIFESSEERGRLPTSGPPAGTQGINDEGRLT